MNRVTNTVNALGATLALTLLALVSSAPASAETDSDTNMLAINTSDIFVADVKNSSGSAVEEDQPGDQHFSFNSATFSAGMRTDVLTSDGFLDFTANQDNWELEFCNAGNQNGDNGAGNGLGSRGFSDFTEAPDSRSFLAIVDMGVLGGKGPLGNAILAEGPSAAADNSEYPDDVHNATNCDGGALSTFEGPASGDNDGIWTAGGLSGPDYEENHEFVYKVSYDIMDGNFGSDSTTILWTIGSSQ